MGQNSCTVSPIHGAFYINRASSTFSDRRHFFVRAIVDVDRVRNKDSSLISIEVEASEGLRSSFALVEMAGEGGMFKLLKTRTRIHSTDIQAAALWGVAATTTALYLVQPFDWIRKTFFEKQEEEK